MTTCVIDLGAHHRSTRALILAGAAPAAADHGHNCV